MYQGKNAINFSLTSAISFFPARFSPGLLTFLRDAPSTNDLDVDRYVKQTCTHCTLVLLSVDIQFYATKAGSNDL